MLFFDRVIRTAGLAIIAGGLAGQAAAQDSAAAGPPAAAPAATDGLACGFPVSPAVYGVWQSLGGKEGRLGCATSREGPSSPSPKGTQSRLAVFGVNGEVVLHVSGPRAGQAYSVSGCFYRLYAQFSGTLGWLGLPIGEAVNTADGSRQAFEGGTMRYARSLNECEATPTPPGAEAAAGTPTMRLAPLTLVRHPATGEWLSLAAASSLKRAQADGYQPVKTQAQVLLDPAPGATLLKLFENDALGAHETLATDQSQRDALDHGFAYEAGQGWVWIDPHPGAVALKFYREPVNGRGRLTAGPEDEADAKSAGYQFIRIEGYAPAAP